MTLLTCYDASRPPASPPLTDMVAGYLGGDTPHVWTPDEWARQHTRYRLPIYVRDGLGAGAGMNSGNRALAALVKLRAPHGSMVALDVETAIDPAYVQAFANQLLGNYGMILYGSRDTVRGNAYAGPYWIADWTGAEHMADGASMTQYLADPNWDLSVASPLLPWWDTRPSTPKPTTPPAAVPQTSIEASNIGATGFDLDWPHMPSATSYRTRLTYQGEVIADQQTSTSACIFRQLTPDHTYTVHVAAGNSAGWSQETNGPQVKTLR